MRVILLLLLAMVAGCATPPAAPAPPAGTSAYRLGAGDKLRIDTFGETQLSGDFTVDGQGRISFPLIGDVAATGRTADEVRAEITSKLAAQALRDPRVTIQVQGYRPVYILGEVTRPGEFAFVSDLSVFALVAKAGGFTYRANQKRVFIRHAGAAAEVEYSLDAATPVLPGDTVRIGDRIF